MSSGTDSEENMMANSTKTKVTSPSTTGHDLPEEAAPSLQPVWHAMTVDEALQELNIDPSDGRKGLSSEEAAKRLEEYGRNELTERRKQTMLERIWRQVNNVLVGILAVVAVVSAARALTGGNVVTNWLQVALIVGVVSMNTCIGIIQEGSAEKAAEALRDMLSSDARVVRNGEEIKIPSKEVVPGDIVVLSLGDRVPADLRMLHVANLACQEAALTGESVPVDKSSEVLQEDDSGRDPRQTPLGDRHNMAFSATLVAQGEGQGLVVATGDHTQIGTINALVSKVERKKTNVLKQIDTVSTYLAIFIMLTAIATFCVAFFKTKLSAIDSVSIALVCAVAMIPEGLEAIVTLTYAWAVSNMAKQNAIIRMLPAVETLGSVTVICSDKTGTLTKNEMTLVAFVTSNAHYKLNVNVVERGISNIVRADTFMADHCKIVPRQSRRSMSHSKSRGSGILSSLARVVSKKSISKTPTTGERECLESPGLPLEGHEDTSCKAVHEEKAVEAVEGDFPGTLPEVTDDIPVCNGESPDVGYIRRTLAGGVLCSKGVLGENGGRNGEIGNPTELAILRAVYYAGVDVEEMRYGTPHVAEVPFSSEYKFMATVHMPVDVNDGASGLNNDYVVHVKGAPDRLLPLCKYQAKAGLVDQNSLEPVDEAYWEDQISILSSHGLRVLALCRGTVTRDTVQQDDQLGPEFVNGKDPWLTMVSLCAIMDPPRPECVAAIKEAHGAGVRVAMITGDHKDTAIAIGDQLGIIDEDFPSALTGPEMDDMTDDELRQAVMGHNVFARSSPQNKIRIVKALQAEGQVASMTGDGVNDAPALKAADMGVAMGVEGTDVAREAAEMILADDNFATIVVAVREGRVVWDNLRKVLLVNTPINNAQGMSVLFGMVLGLEQTLLTPIQVLYCNLICAVTLGFVTAVEPAEEGIMDLPPRRPNKRLIGRYLLLRIAIGTVTLVAVTVGAVFWSKNIGKYNLDEQRAQGSNSLTFGAISVCMSARFAYNSSLGPQILYGNKFAWYSVFIVAVLQVFITYTPGINTIIFQMSGMYADQWGVVVLGMVIVLLVMEAEKALRRVLKAQGRDTDDLEYNPRWDALPEKVDMTLPKETSSLRLTSLRE